MIKKLLLILALLFIRTAAAQLRELTEAEQLMLPAKIACGRDYDKIDAHFKFAGQLYDLGFEESAFCNAESLLRSSSSPEALKSFSAFAHRPLAELFTPEQKQRISLASKEKQPALYRNAIQTAALKNPAAAAYLHFVEPEKLWNSDREADIALVCRRIKEASRNPLLNNLYMFNSLCAGYLYWRAKDYEAALPFCIRLYFHDPTGRSIGDLPTGFAVNTILNRLNDRRRSRALVCSRRDPFRLVSTYLHTQPRMVESFLRQIQDSAKKQEFVRLCLLSCDSVDLQLRSFAFSQLLRRDVTPLLPQYQSLAHDPDPGRRAIAVLLLPEYAAPEELPLKLAEFAADPAAIVRMTVDFIARKRCQPGDYQRFQELVKKQRK